MPCTNETGDPNGCQKYCTEHPWGGECRECRAPIKMTCARWEVLGEYCEGCFGWPVCECAARHTGECPAQESNPASRIRSP